MKKPIGIPMVLLASLLLVGCMGDKPTKEDVKKALVSQYGTDAVFISVNEKEGGTLYERDGNKFYMYPAAVKITYPNGKNPECAGKDAVYSYKCREIFREYNKHIVLLPNQVSEKEISYIFKKNSQGKWIKEK